MSSAKKGTTIELCHRVTAQGNKISVRMLDYLTSAKEPVHGFSALAVGFIDLSRLLWSIEAGLTESAKSNNTFPPEITHELDERFRKVHEEFTVLTQIVSRFVDNEDGRGRFGKRFRMMFADNDVEKLRLTLLKSYNALKVSSAMFRWTIGDVRADAAMGIGYVGLIAGLERLESGGKAPSPSQVPALSTPSPRSSEVSHHSYEDLQHSARSTDRLPVRELRSTASDIHPYHIVDHPSTNDLRHQHEDSGLSPVTADLHKSWRAPSSHSSNSIRGTMYQQPGKYHGEPVLHDVYADESTTSRMFLEEKMRAVDIHEHYHHENLMPESRINNPSAASPFSRQLSSARPAPGESGLVSAVEQKNHRALEQLLKTSAKIDSSVEAGLLRTAIRNHDIETLALLLRYGLDANNFDKEGFTPLFAATQVSCLDGAALLLKHGANANLSAGPESETPLSLAAMHNQMDFVQLYLANNGDPNLITGNGSTALVRSIHKTVSPRLVEQLLTRSNANSKTSEGATALFQAIQIQRVDLMTVLLDHGADPNLPGPKHPLWPSTYNPKALALLLSRGADHKKTPGLMELAAGLRKLESLKVLIDAGVSPNVRKDGAYTPLTTAIRDDSAEIVAFLLENGADPNFKAAEYPTFKCITQKRTHFLPQLVKAGADLHTPKGIIETAIAHNDKGALLYLLEQGVNPNDRCPNGGNTALTTAIRDNNGELVDILLHRGADPAIRGQDWPLCMAVKQPAMLKKLLAVISSPRAFRGVVEMAVAANQIESVKLLLAAGLSIEDKNCGVFSPLTTAIREGHKGLVRYLLDHANADPNAPGEHLPLVKALRSYDGSDTEIIQMLLSRGADINKMHRGWNAILQAVENGDAEILKLLVDMGGAVDLQAVDETGKRVLDIATEREWEEGIALLFPNAKPMGRQ